jgi:cobalt-zinc-cadmium efflux system membrane fusion protein
MIKNENKSILLCAILFLGMTSSCGSKQKEDSQPADEGLIEVTQEQFSNSHMALGQPENMVFSNRVECKGSVFAPADAMSRISPAIAGKVISVHNKIGDRVSAGQTIAAMSGNDFMELQQMFAESAASFMKAKADYERAEGLWAENIGAKKDYLAAKSAYQAAFANYQSTKSRISALHLNAAEIENGHMYSSFPVKAPISGYITKINPFIGEYVDVDAVIAEIVNVNALQLRLTVYESDINKLKSGQAVEFFTSENPDLSLRARLSNIGKTVDTETKTVDCVAAVDNVSGASLTNASFVKASVIVGEKNSKALPVTAVQKQGEEYAVYVVEKRRGKSYMLKRVPVTVGLSEKGYVEITSTLPQKQVVLRGIDTM